MGAIDEYFRKQAEVDEEKVLFFEDAFHEYLDGIMYPGYHSELLSSNLDAYAFEFESFLGVKAG